MSNVLLNEVLKTKTELLLYTVLQSLNPTIKYFNSLYRAFLSKEQKRIINHFDKKEIDSVFNIQKLEKIYMQVLRNVFLIVLKNRLSKEISNSNPKVINSFFDKKLSKSYLKYVIRPQLFSDFASHSKNILKLMGDKDRNGVVKYIDELKTKKLQIKAITDVYRMYNGVYYYSFINFHNPQRYKKCFLLDVNKHKDDKFRVICNVYAKINCDLGTVLFPPFIYGDTSTILFIKGE